MERVLSLARRLGAAILESDRRQALEAARKAVDADPTSRKLFEDFNQQQEKVGALYRDQKPVEPADKKRLVELQQALAADEHAKDLMKAEADFADLMRQVNAAIQSAMSTTEREGERGV